MGNILESKKLLCSDLIFRSEDEIMKEYVFPLNHIFKHRNIKYTIQFYKTHLNGYVDIQGEFPYEGHFGITGGCLEGYQGFDCSHCDDLCLSDFKNDYVLFEGATFKIPEFVHQECKKIIDAYLDQEIV